MCASMSAMAGTIAAVDDRRRSAIVAARNEADRVGKTVAALRGSFPAAAIWVADDASSDGTAEVAMAAGAQVVSRGRRTARAPTSPPPPRRR